MSRKQYHQFITYIIALVWAINGLYCKVLNFVPRHEQIVGRIVGVEYSRILTVLIGLAETLMAIWILIRLYSRANAVLQIIVIATMNILEFILVPDLLLWGKLNAIFAFLFILLIYFNEFILMKNKEPI